MNINIISSIQSSAYQLRSAQGPNTAAVPQVKPAEPSSSVAEDDASAPQVPSSLSPQNQTSTVQASDAQKRVEAQQELQEQDLIRELSNRDREVRAHEQAHAAVGGQYAGAPTYQFQRGPDGVNYAVGGEVRIDISPAATPEETIRKMQVVRAAALAPLEPSPQDRSVAAQAAAQLAQAQAELASSEAENVGDTTQGDTTSQTERTDNTANTSTETQSRASTEFADSASSTSANLIQAFNRSIAAASGLEPQGQFITTRA